MTAYQLTGPAEEQIAAILAQSTNEYGRKHAANYEALIFAAMADVAEDYRRPVLPWQFKGTFRGISVGYEFRIGKAKRRRCLWKRKNCQSSARRYAHQAV